MATGATYVGGKTGTVAQADVVAALEGPANVPLTTPDAQDVINALIALGLVEQSD